MIFIDHFGCLMVLLINPSAATLDRRWAWKSRYVRVNWVNIIEPPSRENCCDGFVSVPSYIVSHEVGSENQSWRKRGCKIHGVN